MSFLWPAHLWFLLALVPLPLAYAWVLRRRERLAQRHGRLQVDGAPALRRGWRRHLAPALLLLACAGLLLAAARPVARVPLPWARTSIMLAMDVSLSMRVSDVKPTRLEAAQAAAKSFLRELPRRIEVGLVTFAGSSQVAQRATLDRDALAVGIDAFQMQMGTAVGDAIVLSLAELFPQDGISLGEMTFGRGSGNGGADGGGSGARGRSLDDRARPPPRQITPVAPGSYDAAAIILLSDGRRTTGIDTLEAARMAAERGVRIHVIGMGTVDGDAATPEGMAIYMRLDEPTLREVARMTGGEYHHAGTAQALQGVYAQLGSRVQLQSGESELAGLLALAAALLAIGGAALSVHWFGRIA